MTTRSAVGNAAWDTLTEVLRRAFPDSKPTTAELDDAVSALVRRLWEKGDAKLLSALGLPQPPADFATAKKSLAVSAAATDGFRYYAGHATHARGSVAPEDAFVGYLPMVRVTLAQTGYASIHTPAGVVEASDHLIFNCTDMQARYWVQTAFATTERVDLITPPRLEGTRFAAVAAFLCYAKADDPAPSYYLLEAGMATGQPMVLFFAKQMGETIVAPTGYTPTPFSAPDHEYRGLLTVVGDEPESLTVRAYVKPTDTTPYITVSVEYESVSSASNLWPALITADAALRVAAIGEALDMQVMGALTPLLAALGMELPWIDKPQKS